MSEYEESYKRKQLGWEQSSCSPVSLSPSIPSTSPAFNATHGTLSVSLEIEEITFLVQLLNKNCVSNMKILYLQANFLFRLLI